MERNGNRVTNLPHPNLLVEVQVSQSIEEDQNNNVLGAISCKKIGQMNLHVTSDKQSKNLPSWPTQWQSQSSAPPLLFHQHHPTPSSWIASFPSQWWWRWRISLPLPPNQPRSYCGCIAADAATYRTTNANITKLHPLGDIHSRQWKGIGKFT